MSDILQFSAGAAVVAPKSLPLAPKVVEVVPFGSTILVELLSKQELTSSLIKLTDNSGGSEKGNANQGYVIALGNGLPADIALKVGDRILINGGFIPVPELDGIPEGRVRGLVEYHSVKAKLSE